MNITFLIGNGFDIGLGLKTRYEDFYKEYCNKTDDDSDNIKNFKEILQNRHSDKDKKIIDWSDFEKAFGEFSEQFKGENADELYLEAYEDFVENFNSYLEKQEKLIKWKNEKNVFDKIYNGVNTYYKVSKEADRDFPSFYKAYNTEAIYNFITFNYTNTVDNCVKILSNHSNKDIRLKIGRVVHVHGYIEDSMIMGVNDVSQILNKELSKNKNVIMELVKPEQNKNSQTTFDYQATNLINKSDIICTYGMSIGETDKKWWKIICDWLKQNANRKLVILKHEKKYSKRFTHNYRKYISPLKEKFLSFSGFEEAIKEKIRSQIYVGINHDVFGINLYELEKKEKAESEVKAWHPVSLSPHGVYGNSHILAQGLDWDTAASVEKAYALDREPLYSGGLNIDLNKTILNDSIKLQIPKDNISYYSNDNTLKFSNEDFSTNDAELIKK